jgi:hypothetical protein
MARESRSFASVGTLLLQYLFLLRRHLGLACHESPQPTLSPRRILGAYSAYNELRTHRSLNKDSPLRRPSQAACSASVSHLSAISMKRDLCTEVRAASANRMHSAALLRNWSKLGKSASISIDMGTDRAHRQRFVISRSMSFKCIPTPTKRSVLIGPCRF